MRHACAMLSVILSVFLASPALAQRDAGPVRVTAQVESDRVYVGQPFVLQVSVEGDTRSQPPTIPAIEGARIEELGSSTSSEVVFDGQRTIERARRVFQYRVTPSREGRIQIPPFETQTREGVRRSDAIVVEAIPPGELDNFKLHLMTSKQRVYEGEPVTLRLTWFLGEEIRTAQFSMPDLPDSFGVYSPADDGVTPAHFQGGQYYEVMFLGERSVARAGRGEYGGRVFSTLTIEKLIVPREAGVFELGPGTVAFTQTTRTRRRSIFDSPLMGADGPTQVVASEPITLEVVPLPREGRPAGFSGLVGKYSIETSADPVEVRVGDPINLSVTVTGDGPPDEIPVLDLSRVPGLDSVFRLSAERPSIERLRTGRRFGTMIRARDASVQEFPPVELSYFDIEAGEYRVVSSAPIPLRVQAAPRVTLPGAAPSISASATDRGASDETPARDASPRAVSRSDLAERRTGLRTLAWGPVGIAAVAIPPGVCVAAALLVAARRRKNANPARRRRERALRAALESLSRVKPGQDAADSASTISESVRGFAADWRGSSRAAMTSDEAMGVVGRASPEASAELGDALARCDEVRFAGGEGFDAQAIAQRVAAALRGADAALRAQHGGEA